MNAPLEMSGDMAAQRTGLAKPHTSFAIAFAALAAALAGCASGLGAGSHDMASSGAAFRAEEGTILQIADQMGQQEIYAVRKTTGELVIVAGADSARFNAGTPVLLQYESGSPKIVLNS